MIYQKPKRLIHTVFLHCSASDRPEHDSVDVIRRWHLARGFSDVGYHYVITKDGTVHAARPTSKIPAAQSGHNSGTIAICLTGHREFTGDQMLALRETCWEIRHVHGAHTRFRGHKEVANKACPVFDYRKVLSLDERGYMR